MTDQMPIVDATTEPDEGMTPNVIAARCGFYGQIRGTRAKQDDSVWAGYGDDVNRICVIAADGLGGYDDGDKASQALLRLFRYHATDGLGDANDIIEKMRTQWRAALIGVGITGGKSGGSTCSLAVADGDLLHYAHVGDSALWLLVVRYGIHGVDMLESVQRLTQDQSMFGARMAAIKQVLAENPDATVAYPGRSSKSRLTNYLTPDRSLVRDIGTWQTGVVELEPIWERHDGNCHIYVVATTDGYHDAFCDDRWQVDETRLGTELCRIINSQQHGELHDIAGVSLTKATTETRDNASLAVGYIKQHKENP